MEPNSFDERDDTTTFLQGSFNETANSIHFQSGQKQQQMSSINPYLLRFIRNQLEVGIKFNNFDCSDIFSGLKKVVIEPYPKIYCLPYSILLTAQTKSIEDIQRSLQDEQFPPSSKYDHDRRELNVKIHNTSQLTFYNIRILKANSRLHKDPRMLDSRYLVDRLVKYYERFYQRIYFRETMILVLYWAYQKDLLEHVISEEALKLLVICNFINFGYGVQNIVKLESNNPTNIKQFKRMNSYCRLNSRTGETQIMQQLIEQYRNYTIQQKRGFYLPEINKFMQIKDVIPIFYPLLPLSTNREQQLEKQISANLRLVIGSDRENMSICKNIAKMFIFWHNKLNKSMRLVIDFSESTAYRHQFAQSYELEVIHPVLNTCLCKLKESPMKNFKRQIRQVIDNLDKKIDAIDVMKKMFEKSRV